MTEAPRGYRMGQRARSVERTREAIVTAAAEAFLSRPYDEIRLVDVARAAGVTQQTLINHVNSKENLLLVAMLHLGRRILAERGRTSPGDVAGAVRALVAQYERYGDANVRFLALEPRLPALAEAFEHARTEHTRWLEEVFGALLPTKAGPRRRTLAALYAVTDVGTWKLLRRDLGHSRATTSAVLLSMLRAVLRTGGELREETCTS
ncbi:TetR/AcrR family transcriptional regulator [Kineococcus sp. SYSU DK003]|uniref:TetR/AcrR family transcriptional regulator n=1 Tax=Kineococcus sp. SYSU DK003 TaxID=3383124 RepID=UPI003D7EB044